MRRALKGMQNHFLCGLAFVIRWIAKILFFGLFAIAGIAAIGSNVAVAWQDPAQYFSVMGIIILIAVFVGLPLLFLIIWAFNTSCRIR